MSYIVNNGQKLQSAPQNYNNFHERKLLQGPVDATEACIVHRQLSHYLGGRLVGRVAPKFILIFYFGPIKTVV